MDGTSIFNRPFDGSMQMDVFLEQLHDLPIRVLSLANAVDEDYPYISHSDQWIYALNKSHQLVHLNVIGCSLTSRYLLFVRVAPALQILDISWNSFIDPVQDFMTLSYSMNNLLILKAERYQQNDSGMTKLQAKRDNET